MSEEDAHKFFVELPGAYSESCQTSKTERLADSILDAWQSSECV